MDWLITAVAISLLCVAAWLLWKRFSNRFKSQPDDYEDYDDYAEEETPAAQEAAADPPRPKSPVVQEAAPALEPKKEA